YIVINICSKQDFGENSNWQYIPDTIKRYIQMRLRVETAMKVIPVSFGQEGASALLVNHDDDDREYVYTQGAENSLVKAKELGWTIVSMKNDWNTVFQPTNTNSKIEN
ncbi:MAG: hypothetical protein WAQ29_11560, partial [Nitrososphaeraceae archaeon]